MSIKLLLYISFCYIIYICSLFLCLPDSPKHLATRLVGDQLVLTLQKSAETNQYSQGLEIISGCLENNRLGEQCLSDHIHYVLQWLSSSMKSFLGDMKAGTSPVRQTDATHSWQVALKLCICIIQKIYHPPSTHIVSLKQTEKLHIYHSLSSKACLKGENCISQNLCQDKSNELCSNVENPESAVICSPHTSKEELSAAGCDSNDVDCILRINDILGAVVTVLQMETPLLDSHIMSGMAVPVLVRSLAGSFLPSIIASILHSFQQHSEEVHVHCTPVQIFLGSIFFRMQEYG